MSIEFINEVYEEVAANYFPSVGNVFLRFPNMLYEYLESGEYSKNPTVDWEQNLAFLWLILCIEGYEK